MPHLAVAVSDPPSPVLAYRRWTPAEGPLDEVKTLTDDRAMPGGRYWVVDRREAWRLSILTGVRVGEIRVLRELYRSAGTRMGEAPGEPEARAAWAAQRAVELVRAGGARPETA